MSGGYINIYFRIVVRSSLDTSVFSVVFIPVLSFQVLNEEEDMKAAFDAGAHGVMTDYPSKLKRFLEDNPQYGRARKMS